MDVTGLGLTDKEFYSETILLFCTQSAAEDSEMRKIGVRAGWDAEKVGFDL